MAEKDLRENPFRDEIFDYLVEHGYQVSNLDDYDYKRMRLPVTDILNIKAND